MAGIFKFSFGPWNIHEGADPFGPVLRKTISFNKKLKLYKEFGNDQNGLKFDQDKTFGSVDIRRAFNQVRILDRHDYGRNGEWVRLNVKAIRTQKDSVATRPPNDSLEIFLKLLEVSRSLDENKLMSLTYQLN